MTFQTRSGVQAAGPMVLGRPICALIEQSFGSDVPLPPLVSENVDRLRRQLSLLKIDEVVGLGDIPKGASMLLLRADVLFELGTIEAMAQSIGSGAQIDDMLAAVHVEAGDAAAALSKFRRADLSGWAPFQIRFMRLGKFKAQTGKTGWLTAFLPKRAALVAKAALLPRAKGSQAGEGNKPIPKEPLPREPMQSVWARSPGLDPLVRFANIHRVQKDVFDAFGLSAEAWRGIGFLLLLVMISFGVLGWGWAGASAGFLAAGCFDLAERADDLKNLRFTKSLGALCIQALVIAALWLFVVFAAGSGTPAQMPALLLIALPVSFVFVHAAAGHHSFGRDAAFGVYGHAILAGLSVTMLPVPLLSLFFSGLGLIVVLSAGASAIVALATDFFARKAPKGLSSPA